MTNLAEKLNFSMNKENDSCVKIRKWHSIDYFNTLYLYLVNHNMEDDYSEDEIDAAAEVLSIFGQDDKSTDYYYFWIDE